MQIKLISTRKVEHLTSFWYRGPGIELGNGLLFGKKWCEKCVGLGEGADRRRPHAQIARVLFSLCLLHFRDFPTSLAQATSYQSLMQAFSLPLHLWEEGNTTLLRMPSCGAHVMHSCARSLSEKMRNQLIFVANSGPKMGLFFCFVWLLLFVYQSLDRLCSVKFRAFCLRFVFLPFTPCACFLLFPCVQFSLFPALFT